MPHIHPVKSKLHLKQLTLKIIFLTHEIFAQILGSWCAKNGSLLPGSSIHPSKLFHLSLSHTGGFNKFGQISRMRAVLHKVKG